MNTDVLHAGHCGDAGGAVHPIAGVRAVAVTAVLATRYLLSFRSDRIFSMIDKYAVCLDTLCNLGSCELTRQNNLLSIDG